MGWLGSIFGSRKRREERRATEARLRAALDDEGPTLVWPQIVAALRRDPESDDLLRLAAHALRLASEAQTAELFDRAADAPHDPQRLFELGSELLSQEQAEVAAVLLTRALAFVPFDAVVRSELALAHARSGRPRDVLEALALHPCLAEDPGALFQFGWASLLTFDLDAAEGVLRELSSSSSRRVGSLHRMLELALERARTSAAETPPDARDYYYIEQGALLLDASGPLGGRYEHLEADAAWSSMLFADLGAVLRRRLPAVRHVVALDDAHWPLAEAVARACEGSVLPAGRGRLPTGILPLLRADLLETRLDEESRDRAGMLVFALTMDWSRSLARAPDLVGAFARTVAVAQDAFRSDVGASGRRAPSQALASFVEARAEWLPPGGPRVKSAYVPDAPLPRTGG